MTNCCIISNTVITVSSYLLNLSWITNYITTKLLAIGYRLLGFKIDKFRQTEVADCFHMFATAEFEQHAKNINVIRENKVPVILAYGMDDPLIESDLFSEIGQTLGLKTINELANLNDECGKIMKCWSFN